MSTLLRDIIDIPEYAGANDYVLRLTEGVDRDKVAETVAQYVVTDDIAERFDEALGLVAESVADGRSRAAYLQGSFGSGKSHFMAVLHGILGHHPAARAIPELAPILHKYDDALTGMRFLRLAFHFIDATSVEDVIFRGYLDQVRALHPGAPLPAVHEADHLLADADSLRVEMGDEKFFAALNGSSASGAGDDPWGAVLESHWTAQLYDGARVHGSPSRQDLVSALTATMFRSFTRSNDWVSLDEGLRVLTEHAKGLGYDAIVAFLDELVLWLMFRVRDTTFFGREVQKLTKLVEGGQGLRPLPLVSFVARQVDLRQYFAEAGAASGSEVDAITQAFTHQAGRFRDIVLGDDNLPYVAQKRLLTPKDVTAAAVLERAFGALDRRDDVWRVLLDGENTDDRHRGASEEAFRRTYPFSPALVSTLRSLASAMQRDRTALKVMQALLVDQRDTLTVDDVIPVGDAYDLLVRGNQGQAVSPEMAGKFRNAHALYADKLRPVLLGEHGLTEEEGRALPAGHPFRADDRLAKTLVLSAIADHVPALRDLTPGRLAALNHGSIVTMIDGEEATEVLARVHRWAGHVPELHVSGDLNPTIRLQIADVDYESVVGSARAEDTPGRRRELVKDMVWRALDIPTGTDDLAGVTRKHVVWRGSGRDIEVVFGNIRDTTWLSEDRFRASAGTWRFVVDYPFDEQGHSAHEDLVRLEALQAQMTSQTVAWVPRFLSRDKENQLGRLVVLDYLLRDTHFTKHAQHLQPGDRETARLILQNQRSTLTAQLERAIQEAYGAAHETPGTLVDDPSHDRVLVSLTPSFTAAKPVGATLDQAFTHLVDQALRHSFPAHPRFEPEGDEIRRREVDAVLAAVDAALGDPDGRAPIDGAQRQIVRRVANPLELGWMGQTHFVFNAERFTWERLIGTRMARDGLADDAPVTAGQLRQWVRAAKQAGLVPVVEDLVGLAWARRHNRAAFIHGTATTDIAPGKLPDHVEFRAQQMPPPPSWRTATTRAMALFGLPNAPYLTATSLQSWEVDLRSRVAAVAATAGALVPALEAAYARLGLDTGGVPGRLVTARAAADLVSGLVASVGPVALVQCLAEAVLPAPDQHVGTSLASAGSLAHALGSFRWAGVDRLRAVTDERRADAQAIVERLRAAVAADEFATRLAPALERADREAFDFFSTGGPVAPVVTPLVPPPTPPAPTGRRSGTGSRAVRGTADLDAALSDLRSALDANPGHEIRVTWEVLP